MPEKTQDLVLLENARLESAVLLHQLALRYPNQLIANETIDAYVSDLEEIPLSLIQEACRRIALDETFFPPLARIVQVIELIRVESAPPPLALPTPEQIDYRQQMSAILGGVAQQIEEDLRGWPRWKGARELAGIPPTGASLVGIFTAVYHELHERWPDRYADLLTVVREYQDTECRHSSERGRESYRWSIACLVNLIETDTSIPVEQLRQMIRAPEPVGQVR